MKQVVVFDFDGTLTTKDTLLEFIRYACGSWPFAVGFLRYAPLLVLMKLGLYPNYKAKQRVFAHFFRGMSLADFDKRCRDFANNNRHLLRPQGIKALEQAVAKGNDVLVVSASIDNWVRPFFEGNRSPMIVGTQVERIQAFLMVLVLGITGAAEFFLIGKYSVLLTADKKVYVISIVQLCAVFANTIVAVVLIKDLFVILVVNT